MGKGVSIYLDKETIERINKLQEELTDRSRSFIINMLLNEALNKRLEDD